MDVAFQLKGFRFLGVIYNKSVDLKSVFIYDFSFEVFR